MEENHQEKLELRFLQAKDRMEQLRHELSLITEEVIKDPNRNFNTDEEVWSKNMELSHAIKEFMRLEKQCNKSNSEFY